MSNFYDALICSIPWCLLLTLLSVIRQPKVPRKEFWKFFYTWPITWFCIKKLKFWSNKNVAHVLKHSLPTFPCSWLPLQRGPHFAKWSDHVLSQLTSIFDSSFFNLLYLYIKSSLKDIQSYKKHTICSTTHKKRNKT